MVDWIVCPACGSKHSPRADGACPRCRTRVAPAVPAPAVLASAPAPLQPSSLAAWGVAPAEAAAARSVPRPARHADARAESLRARTAAPGRGVRGILRGLLARLRGWGVQVGLLRPRSARTPGRSRRSGR